MAKCGIQIFRTIRRSETLNSKVPNEKEMLKGKRGTSVEFVAYIEVVEISVAWKDNKIFTILTFFTGELPFSQVKRYDKKEKRLLRFPAQRVQQAYGRRRYIG